jgi:adenylylsulfate kinase-like enzyme
MNSKEPERRLSRLELAQDMEKAWGSANEARYENARWWRNLNRGMSVLGVIILAAIVSARSPFFKSRKSKLTLHERLR